MNSFIPATIWTTLILVIPFGMMTAMYVTVNRRLKNVFLFGTIALAILAGIWTLKLVASEQFGSDESHLMILLFAPLIFSGATALLVSMLWSATNIYAVKRAKQPRPLKLLFFLTTLMGSIAGLCIWVAGCEPETISSNVFL